MNKLIFADEDKVKYFDEIASCFYEGNFGRMAKSDFELMMFHFYMERLNADCRNEDGTIDYSACSDYKISRALGITQQRVRNLKVKSQLVYPMTYDWKLALAKLTEHARYDKNTGKVTLNIPDPNLYLEIQNFIEERGAYVEKQLNSKVLQIRAGYFIDLVISLDGQEEKQRIIQKIKEQFREQGKSDSTFDESNIGKSLIEGAVNITTVAANLSGLIPPQNVLGNALITLLSRS